MASPKKIKVIVAGAAMEVTAQMDDYWVRLGDIISMDRKSGYENIRVEGDWLSMVVSGMPMQLCLGAKEAKRWAKELSRSSAPPKFGQN